jgi:hypothetical protein
VQLKASSQTEGMPLLIYLPLQYQAAQAQTATERGATTHLLPDLVHRVVEDPVPRDHLSLGLLLRHHRRTEPTATSTRADRRREVLKRRQRRSCDEECHGRWWPRKYPDHRGRRGRGRGTNTGTCALSRLAEPLRGRPPGRSSPPASCCDIGARARVSRRHWQQQQCQLQQ